MSLHLLWTRATRAFPGLALFTLPADPAERDRYIRATIGRLRRGLERDVSAEVAAVWREEGAARARTRRLLLRVVPQLREARALAVDAQEPTRDEELPLLKQAAE